MGWFEGGVGEVEGFWLRWKDGGLRERGRAVRAKEGWGGTEVGGGMVVEGGMEKG